VSYFNVSFFVSQYNIHLGFPISIYGKVSCPSLLLCPIVYPWYLVVNSHFWRSAVVLPWSPLYPHVTGGLRFHIRLPRPLLPTPTRLKSLFGSFILLQELFLPCREKEAIASSDIWTYLLSISNTFPKCLKRVFLSMAIIYY